LTCLPAEPLITAKPEKNWGYPVAGLQYQMCSSRPLQKSEVNAVNVSIGECLGVFEAKKILLSKGR
jgi:hypothetical protein